MKQKKHCPLGLEALESRWVPATIRFDGSNLFVSNPVVVAGASSITITEIGVDQFQVTDNGNNNGMYTVGGNITVQGNNAKDTVAVKVNSSGLAGNLSVTTGNGASTVTVDGDGSATPFIAGNTVISVAKGANSVALGDTNGLTDNGTVTVTARGTGANSVTLGGGGATSTFLGAVNLYGFPTVTLGATAGDTFAGGISIQNTNTSLPGTVILEPTATDLGGLTVNGGTGGTNLSVSGNVLGNLITNLGNGANSVTLGGGGAAITLGNLYVSAGNGANSITLGGGSAVTDLGSAFVNLGNGANQFGTSAGFQVNNNLFVNDGNGGLDVTTNTFQGNVLGALTVNAGNGNNSFTFDGAAGATVGGPFTYTGGNAGNALTVTTAAGQLVDLDVHFGNSPGTGAGGLGNNVFTIGAAAPSSLTGLVSWGVPSLVINGNAFNDGGYVWTNNITLINIPS